MAAQARPTYSQATIKSEKIIIDKLVEKYGIKNVSWPIIFQDKDETFAYVYEKNRQNQTNGLTDMRPISNKKIPSFFLDYTSDPRKMVPTGLDPHILDDEFESSYSYIVDSPYSSIDLDYVWYTGSHYKGMEFTTFFMPFTTHSRALELISKMNRRPSWRGEGGAKAFHKIIDTAEDLNIDYYLVCANTISRVGSDLDTNSNVCIIKMKHEQVNRIEKGIAPLESYFMTFKDFLEWL